MNIHEYSNLLMDGANHSYIYPMHASSILACIIVYLQHSYITTDSVDPEFIYRSSHCCMLYAVHISISITLAVSNM